LVEIWLSRHLASRIAAISALTNARVGRWVAIMLFAVSVGGASGYALRMPQLDRARDLLTGIFDDVAAIANSFAGGPDDPHSPVVDRTALAQDKAHLDAATQKAQALADELQRQQADTGRGH
jgi:hypothetical protein